MKVIARAFSIIPFIIIALIIATYIFYYVATSNLTSKVEDYLINDQGYSSEEIEKVEAKLRILPLIQVDVIFVDEPDHVYTYRERGRNILQISAHKLTNTSADFSHIEE